MAELNYSKKLSGLLASFSIIIMIGANLIQTMTINVTTLIFVITKVIPIAFVMGFLGYHTGKILDNPKIQKKEK